MRLIELGEAMRMVKNSREDCPATSINGRAIWETAHNCALSCLTSCPTIDPSTLRPKGEWIDGMKCSECGQVDFTKPNFCPNCGADMRGDNNGC